MIEEGPPDTLPAQFEGYFGEKEAETRIVAEEAARELGWNLPVA